MGYLASLLKLGLKVDSTTSSCDMTKSRDAELLRAGPCRAAAGQLRKGGHSARAAAPRARDKTLKGEGEGCVWGGGDGGARVCGSRPGCAGSLRAGPESKSVRVGLPLE